MIQNFHLFHLGMGYSAAEGSSYHKPNLPTPQAGRKTTMTTTLRKTGSIGNLRAVMTPSGSTPKIGPKKLEDFS